MIDLEKIKNIFNKIDPLGLIQSGFPDDEYQPEYSELFHFLLKKDVKSSEEIFNEIKNIFIKWFGGKNSESCDQKLKEISEIIFKENHKK